MKHSNLTNARANKKDEFYTLYKDIEDEISHYDLSYKKIISCCDNGSSNFTKYFINNFDKLKLKSFTATSMSKYDSRGLKIELNQLRGG